MPGNGGLPPLEQQTLRAGADAAPLGLDDDVLRAGRVEREPRERDALRLLQNDRE